MFERYTERARRVIFFARYEASQLGSNSIETEHLLLGLIREGKGLTSRIFSKSHLSMETIRKEIEGRALYRDKVSTSVDIPLSLESKRVLGYARRGSGADAPQLHRHRAHPPRPHAGGEERRRRHPRPRRGCASSAVREDIVQLLNEKANVGKTKETPAPLRVLPRPHGGGRPRRPGPAGGTRGGAGAHHPGPLPPDAQQPRAHRRARGRARPLSSRASPTRSSRATCPSTWPTRGSWPSTSR